MHPWPINISSCSFQMLINLLVESSLIFLSKVSLCCWSCLIGICFWFKLLCFTFIPYRTDGFQWLFHLTALMESKRDLYTVSPWKLPQNMILRLSRIWPSMISPARRWTSQPKNWPRRGIWPCLSARNDLITNFRGNTLLDQGFPSFIEYWNIFGIFMYRLWERHLYI